LRNIYVRVYVEYEVIDIELNPINYE